VPPPPPLHHLSSPLSHCRELAGKTLLAGKPMCLDQLVTMTELSECGESPQGDLELPHCHPCLVPYTAAGK
jgi:hypothetical protein